MNRSLPSQHAAFVWPDDGAPFRNQFVRFERDVVLERVPGEFPLHLFADTRYRLLVNSNFVSTGPGRFVTQFPEFDSHDIASFFRPGKNIISVEVNFFGASSYQSMPDGQPGFIAWGGVGDVDCATPGEWRAYRLDAWRSDAPLYSFAQNPVEICDTRISDGGQLSSLAMLTGDRAPWGKLRPYSGAPLSLNAHRPKRIELAGRLAETERVVGFMLHDPGAIGAGADGRTRPWSACVSWLYSPKPQQVPLSCFWSDFFCNGSMVSINTDTLRGNHGYCTLELERGWNQIVASIEVLTEYWAYLLGLPIESGVTMHGRRDRACEFPISVAPVGPRESLVLPAPDADEAPEGWTLQDGNPALITPARMVAWDVPAADAIRGIDPRSLSEVSVIESPAATWCFSFAGEFLGHIVVDVEAPANTILDIACDDWQGAHGGVALYQSSPFTDAADRFILRGGRQRVELFHPRGGKLIQVTMRGEADSKLILHDIFVRSRHSLPEDETQFACDLPSLEWVWPVALRTLNKSTDDVFSDSPWRERSSYIGDSYVNIHLMALLTGDLRTARRTLRLFAQAQLPNGQLPCCVPSWLNRPHEDFSLIWMLAIHDYWAMTGDVTLLEEVWPTVKKIWASTSWDPHPSGLWNARKTHLFIDWGVMAAERSGMGVGSLNAFRFGAAKACERMAAALGRKDDAASFAEAASAVEDAMMRLLWDEDIGSLRASLDTVSPALHANVLALTFGIGNVERRQRIIEYLDPLLRENLAVGLRKGNARKESEGHLELYFMHYALPALACHGRADLAEDLIARHFEFLSRIGNDTLPECFCRAEKVEGSRCHSWSGAAAIYAARFVLGVRQIEPGNPRRLICDPIIHGITRASGRIAHLDGWIEISWERHGGEFLISAEVPEGITLATRESCPARAQDHAASFA